MNDNLKNYSEQPAPEVWDTLRKTLRRTRLRRMYIGGAAAAAILAVAVSVVEFYPQQPIVHTSNTSEVAMVQTSDNQLIENVQVDLSASQVAESSVPVRAAKTEAAVQPVVAVAEPVVVRAESSEATTPAAFLTEGTQRPAAAAPAEKAVPMPVVAETHSEAVAKPESVRKVDERKSSVITNIKDTILWVPNIIAPNSDEESLRQFLPRLSSESVSISNYRLVMFNRGGQQVFVSNDINNGWDGTYRGREMPQAAYVYVIYYTDKEGLRHQRKGTVTLVR